MATKESKDTKTKTKVTLSTLASELQALAEAVEVDPETGEVTGMDEFEAAQAAFEDKAAAVAVAIIGAKAYVEGLKQYKKNIADRQAAGEKKIESLERYLADNMERLGIRRLDRTEARITLRDSEAVVIDDEELIPMDYKHISWDVSKTSIKRAMADGQEVKGAHIEKRTNVVIK